MISDRFISIYIHIPFCRTRCSYCDFNTYAGCENLIDQYISSLIIEIDKASSFLSDEHQAGTIYFGGGTPTIMKVEMYTKILHSLKNKFIWSSDIEITTEANPKNIHAQYLDELHSAGINRISFGMQSAEHGELEILGRKHQFSDVEISLEQARRAGFQNINLDLIFGVPMQTLSTWKKSLEEAVRLEPNHLSLYSLILEENTPLYRSVQTGRLPPVDSDLEAEMYAYAMDFLRNKGFKQYEISNWASENNYQCRHNIQYWRNGTYLGFGAGAHSHYRHQRWGNEHGIPEYIHRVIENEEFPPAAAEINEINKMDEIRETMMMGMRLTKEGIDADRFYHRFGRPVHEVFRKEIERLIEKDLIEEYLSGRGRGRGRGIRLTRKGRMLGNQVFLQFME